MRTTSGAAKRRVSEPVERARVEALVDRGTRVPRAYLAASRVAPDRTQKKLRLFDERRDGRIVVDLEGLQRDHPGALVRFQLRESGQVLGTAQWHIPEGEEQPPAPAAAAPPTPAPAVASHELQRLRGELAGVRGEARHLAEELRRLRSELTLEQVARHRAEAERDTARQAEERGRERRDVLRDKLLKAAVGKKESEIAFRLLFDRVPEDVEEVSRIVRGRE